MRTLYILYALLILQCYVRSLYDIIIYDVNDTNSVGLDGTAKYRIPTSDKQTNENNNVNDPGGSFITGGR